MTSPAARTAATRVPQRVAAASLAVAASLSMTGCYNEGTEVLDTAVGEVGAVGPVELRGFLLVSLEEGAPGRLLGTLNNEADIPVEVTISDDDDTVVIIVPAEDDYELDTNEVIFETVDGIPGSLTPIIATTDEETTELSIPVRDGTLERYQPYLPDLPE